MDKETMKEYYNRIEEEKKIIFVKALAIGDYMRNGFGKGNLRRIKKLEKTYNEVLEALYALKENLDERLNNG